MATIRDVARVAGVSVATVSRVLNNPHTVRELTRLRVQQTIQEMNFRPDPTARRLSTGRTFTIGVLLPFLTRPSFVERLRGVEATLSHSAYDLVVASVDSTLKRDAWLDAVAREHRFDGCIVMSLRPTDAEAEAILANRIPLVLVDESHPLLPGVDVDDPAGGRMAAEYLAHRGHRRVAFIGDDPHELLFRTSQERLQGFQAGINAAGMTLAEQDCFWVAHSRRAVRPIVEQLLSRPATQRPTAIFASTDTTALGVLDGLRQAGLRAPDDLAVMGFDDMETAELYDLTTIHQPLFQSGVQGTEALLAWLESGQPPTPPHRLLPLTLVERGTT